MRFVPLQIAGLFVSFLISRASAGSRLKPYSTAFFFWSSSTPEPTAAAAMVKLESASAERNKDPLWKVLERRALSQYPLKVDAPLRVLEVAAGAGVHTHHFSKQLHAASKPFCWYPTDPDETSRASQQAYVSEEPSITASVESPLQLTLDEHGIIEMDTDAKLEGSSMDWIININMIHISPWAATLGLMKIAGEKLKPGGILFLYGPYREGGTCVESNIAFEEWLKEKDPDYGIRDLEKVIEVAESNGLTLQEKIQMPANNLSVILRKI